MKCRLKRYKLFAICYVAGFCYIIAFLTTPATVYNFVSDELQTGDKYVLMFLKMDSPPFSDADGAEVFKSRNCGCCFVTNNKGFLPLSEYDTVIVGQEDEVSESTVKLSKRYILRSDRKCLEYKLLNCTSEPILTSFWTEENYTLCSLCKYLLDKRLSKRKGLYS